jgi:hypothetical protein
VLFHLLDEGAPALLDDDRWPGVTVLIPAFNEEAVIATSVGARRSRPTTRTSSCSSSTTARPTGPRRSPVRPPAAIRGARCCATR